MANSLRLVRVITVAGLLCASQSLAADSVVIAGVTPFAAHARIAHNVRNECTQLGEKLSHFIQHFAKKRRVDVERVAVIDVRADGLVLAVEIDDAVSLGGAMRGHAKFMQASATLYRDGKVVGQQTYTRDSMGGLFGEYKSSCAVLGRTAKVLGKDFASWLVRHEAVAGQDRRL